MEEHIKKYSQIAQTGHYEPPKIEESKEKCWEDAQATADWLN